MPDDAFSDGGGPSGLYAAGIQGLMSSNISFRDLDRGTQAANIFGDVTNKYYEYQRLPHVEQSFEPQPLPTILIHFGRDGDFIRREAIFDQLEKLCTVPGSRVALVGFSGVGKSQIAIEYAYQVRNRSPGTWVFWIHASNAGRYEQSMKEVADVAKIPERHDPKKNIHKLVGDWLRSDKSGNWVLILDNVDDAGFLVDVPPTNDDPNTAPTPPLISYIPHCQHGSILVTSQRESAAESLVEARNVIKVHPMESDDAVALIRTKLGDTGDQEDTETIRDLATALDFMPMAIVQATSYLSKRVPCISVKEYIQKLRSSEEELAELLTQQQVPRVRRDWEAKNSIFLTWQISFEQLRKTSESAADTLSLMSFCDRQGIPVDLLVDEDQPDGQYDDNNESDGSWTTTRSTGDSSELERPESPDGLGSHSPLGHGTEPIRSRKQVLEEDIPILRDCSFISVEKDGKTLQMHSLVQLATRHWLEAHDDLERWKLKLTIRLWWLFPMDPDEDRRKCQLYLPHAKLTRRYAPVEEALVPHWAELMANTSAYLRNVGSYFDAQELVENAMEFAAQWKGNKEIDGGMVSLMQTAARVYTIQGRHADAQNMAIEALNLARATFGEGHNVTLYSMVMVAVAHRPGRVEDPELHQVAETMLLGMVEHFESTKGPNHADTLVTKAHLAHHYSTAGNVEEAVILMEEIVEMCRVTLGLEHFNTIYCMLTLLKIYRSAQRFAEAEQLGIELMELSQAALGSGHQWTLSSMAEVAATYFAMDNMDRAEEICKATVDRYREFLGPKHPSTLFQMHLLALLLFKQENWSDAEDVLLEVIANGTEVRGLRDPKTLEEMHFLALFYLYQDKFEKAENLLVEVVQIRREVLGSDHADTLDSVGLLRQFYKNESRWEDARRLGGADWEGIEDSTAESGTGQGPMLSKMIRRGVRKQLLSRLRRGLGKIRFGKRDS